MNLLGDGIVLNQRNSTQIENDLRLSQENPNLLVNQGKNNFFIPGISEEKINIFNNNSSEQSCDIMSYYYTTHKYLLNSEEYLNIFSFHKGSRNFVRKNKVNTFNRNEFNNNYNENYINNYEQMNNCTYTIKHSFLNKNYNDIKQMNNFFLGNNLYLCNNSVNKSQNIIYNSGNFNKQANDEKNNSSNNFCDLSNLNVNNINLSKDVINQIDCPPFIPSNYPKKEDDKFPRKKSEDSLSKDKESDSTSAISDKKEDEISNEPMKKNNKRRIIEKNDTGDYMVVMFGRRGWICKLCNNFNYETRVKCNRCGILKKPKKILDIKQKGEEEHNKEGDWRCVHCKNLNYSFRTICNRCKLPKVIPFINNNVNPMVNQISLPIFQLPHSLFRFHNGKTMIYNNQ
jgi:hypothetical protein